MHFIDSSYFVRLLSTSITAYNSSLKIRCFRWKILKVIGLIHVHKFIGFKIRITANSFVSNYIGHVLSVYHLMQTESRLKILVNIMVSSIKYELFMSKTLRNIFLVTLLRWNESSLLNKC